MTLKSLMLLFLLLAASVWSFPSNQLPEATDATASTLPQRPILLIQNNVRAEDAKNYEITIPKDVKPGEPCLTISWKTNPDGSGPDDPKIYMVDGYFKVLPQLSQQAQNKQQ